MKHKAFPCSFKAVDAAAGTFEAIVSVFGNVDRGGDRVVKGAFSKSLERWQSKGRPIPVIFSHEWGNLDAHIGQVLEAKETEEGLWVKGQLEMDEPFAARVYKKLQNGTLAEFSFAYDTLDEKRQNGANELMELDLLEVGPTLIGMNAETRLLGVKSLDAEAKSVSAVGKKDYLSGSWEERRSQIAYAVRARYGDSNDRWSWICATFEDRVIVGVEDGEGKTSYREVNYSISESGVTLGEDREVELQTVVVAKEAASANPVAKSEEPERAKAEEPRERSTFAMKMALDLLELDGP